MSALQDAQHGQSVGPSALAIDIGGSGARAARVGPDGILVAHGSEPLDASTTAEEAVRRLLRLVSTMRERNCPGVVALGVSIPAFVDSTGCVAHSVNLPALEGIDLPALLEPHAGMPVVVVPDVACAAIAEARLGNGRSVERVLCTVIGTGVNAAMTVSGRVLETAFGCLGDAGHVVVEADGPLCPCGGAGCLEAITSGAAIAKAAQEQGLGSVSELLEHARAGALEPNEVMVRSGRALGRAIASWCALLWPQKVLVAGGLAAAGELLLAPARAEIALVGAPYIVGKIELDTAALGQKAALVGAGLAALDSC